MAARLRLEAEDLEAPVLAEVMVEREAPSGRARDSRTANEMASHRRPVLVRVAGPGCAFARSSSRGMRPQDAQQARSGATPCAIDAAQLAEQEGVRLRFDVVGDEAGLASRRRGAGRPWPRARGRRRRRSRSARIALESHRTGRLIDRSARACPGRRARCPPPRPAPTRRKIGWSFVKGGIFPVVRRARLPSEDLGTRRRPRWRMLGSSPRRIIRHTVDGDTPSTAPAWATPSPSRMASMPQP